MKERLQQILLNPHVISVFVTIGIIILLPNYFSKYKLELESTIPVTTGTQVYYQDLDNDAISEKIIAQVNRQGNASYVIYASNGDLVDQFNLNHPFTNSVQWLWFQDFDSNGYAEIYTITQNSDSLYLNQHEVLGPDELWEKDLFFDRTREFQGSFNVQVSGGPNTYTNFNRWSEIVFAVNSGFSGYPRIVYKYLPEKKEFIKSAHLGNPMHISAVVDVNNDGQNEILIRNSSAGNTIPDSISAYSDYSTWLHVLNNDLTPLFEPIEFPALGSIQLNAITAGDKVEIIGVFRSKQQEKLPSRMFALNTEGVIQKEQELKQSQIYGFFVLNDSEYLYSVKDNDSLYWLDSDFRPKKYLKVPGYSTSHIKKVDLDQDGALEWIVRNFDHSAVAVYDANFKNQVIAQLANSDPDEIRTSQINLNEGRPAMFIQKGNRGYTYSYNFNPAYYFKYLIYLGIYLLVLVLVKLAAKGQALRMEKQQELADEISRLQIKTIKNQVDPHFVFNALNSISEMTLSENKLEADQFICSLSDFMRGTLKSSDRIRTTLKDELEYTENFIRLQQMRFQNNFDYSIEIDPLVNLDYQVPKHVLFCYAENSIKHAVGQKKGGHLKLSARENDKALLLSISDNGGGLNGSLAPENYSTGTGMKIMDRVFDLYQQLTKQRIDHKINELKDDSNRILGLQVEIRIYKPTVLHG